MGFASVMQASQTLNSSMEALAALGAWLRFKNEGLKLDPEVERRLEGAAAAVFPAGVPALEPKQAAVVLAFIAAFFRQATDLLEHPERPPGWTFEDPTVLQAQGEASRLIARTFEAYAKSDPDFAATLNARGTFLDVGTGVGLLAVEMARSFPHMNVVGIDILEPALRLADRNVAEHMVADRVELRLQDVAKLDDEDAFDFAWFAGPFIPAAIVPVALNRIFRAVRPGGFLVFGTYNPPPSELGMALTALRIVRSGGKPWSAEEALSLVAAAGFVPLQTFTTGSPILVAVGRKPA